MERVHLINQNEDKLFFLTFSQKTIWLCEENRQTMNTMQQLYKSSEI